MRRPDLDPTAIVCGALLAVVAALVVALLAQGPLPPSGRVVSVDRTGTVTD